MEKRGLPYGFEYSRRLMARLAGGALVCCAPAANAANQIDVTLPPSRELVLVTAVQSALAENAGQSTPVFDTGEGIALRLSQMELVQPLSGKAPRWMTIPDVPTRLRSSRELSQREIEAAGLSRQGNSLNVPSSAGSDTQAVNEVPLRLSQMNLLPPTTGAVPRWSNSSDLAPLLRSSRELSMPGAAGVGRQLQPGQNLNLPASDRRAAGYEEADTPNAAVLRQFDAESPNSSVSENSGGFNLGLGWEVPPVRWGGSLGFAMQRGTSSTGSSSQEALLANLIASSYIYAPWFATVSGRLGITSSSSNSSSTVVGGSDTNDSSNIVGGADLNMFSSSRFPFRAYFDRSDSRASGNIVSTDYISTRFGVTQNYRAEDGMSSGNFMLDRNVINSSEGRRDAVTALSGSYSTVTGIVNHSVSGRYSLGERDGTGELASLIGFNTSHTANISDTLNLGGTVNFSDSDIRTAGSGGELFVNRARYLQFNTYGSWMPEFEDIEDLPLTLTGGLRYTAQENQYNGTGFNAQTMGGNLSALYRYSNNLALSANTAVNNITQSNGGSQLLTQVGSNINYIGNPLVFGNFSYNWNVGGNANWQSSSGQVPANSTYGGQAMHSISRLFQVGESETLSFAFSQSLTVSESQLVGGTQSLNHNISTTYGMNGGERFSGSITGMLSDVISTGFNEQHYSTFNLGFYGQGQLSQQSNMNLNMMFNWSDQTNQGLDAFGVPTTISNQQMTLNGSAAYSHQRFAGVRGLRYNFILAADTRLRDDRLYGNTNAELDKARFTLTNRFEYRLGLLDFRLSLINNEVDGKKNALLFLQVTRQIGTY